MWPFKPTLKTVERLLRRRDVAGLLALYRKTNNESVALAAVDAVGGIGDPVAAGSLLDSLRAEHFGPRGAEGLWSETTFAIRIGPALAKMGTGAVPELIRAVETCGKDQLDCLVAAETALQMIGEPALLPLAKVCTNGNRHARWQSVRDSLPVDQDAALQEGAQFSLHHLSLSGLGAERNRLSRVDEA